MRRTAIRAGLFMAALLGLAAAVSGQDPKDTKDTPAAKAKGTLPANYGKLGLSDEQKAKIHAIVAEYKSKLDTLAKQTAELKAKQKKELEAVLTETQIEQLRKLQTGETAEKKPTDKKPDAKPAETKPDDKKPGDKSEDKKPVDKKPDDK